MTQKWFYCGLKPKWSIKNTISSVIDLFSIFLSKTCHDRPEVYFLKYTSDMGSTTPPLLPTI